MHFVLFGKLTLCREENTHCGKMSSAGKSELAVCKVSLLSHF